MLKSTVFSQEFEGFEGILTPQKFFPQARANILQYPERHWVLWSCSLRDFAYIIDSMGYRFARRLMQIWVDLNLRTWRGGELGAYADNGRMLFLNYFETDKDFFVRIDDVADTISREIQKDGFDYRVQLCAGLYVLSEAENRDPDIEKLYMLAAEAHHSAMFKPGNAICTYEREPGYQYSRAQILWQSFGEAMRKRDIHVVLQPTFDTLTHAIIGAEAFSRWDHPQLGMLSAAEFIPALKFTGQVQTLDLFMCEEVCAILKNWNIRGIKMPDYVSLNLDTADVYATDMSKRILEIVQRYHIPRGQLRIELSCKSYMYQPQLTVQFANALRDGGVDLILDDFGGDFATPSLLRNIPYATLKVGPELSRDHEGAFSDGLIRATVHLAHSIERPVIALQIETEKQFRRMQSLGCSLMQGYYFSRPLPVAEFEALQRNNIVQPLPQDFSDALVRSTLRLFSKLLDRPLTNESEQKLQLESLTRDIAWRHQLYKQLVELPGAVVYELDPYTGYLNLQLSNDNGQIRRITEPRYFERGGKLDWIAPESVEVMLKNMEEALQRPINNTAEVRFDFNNSGTFHWYRVRFCSIADDNGRVYRIFGQAHNIQQEIEFTRKLKEKSELDLMTGLSNHITGFERVGEVLQQGGTGTLFFIDLDDFKRLNDTLGHHMGDEALKTVARVLLHDFRSNDIKIRYGGDEFAVFALSLQDISIVKERTGRLLNQICAVSYPGYGSLHCSVGAAIARPGECDAEALFRRADKALYEAKLRGGKNCGFVSGDTELLEKVTAAQ